MTLDFPGQVGANVHISWLDPFKIRRMTVVGSEKMIVFDDVSADCPDHDLRQGRRADAPPRCRDLARELRDVRRVPVVAARRRRPDPEGPFTEPLLLEMPALRRLHPVGRAPAHRRRERSSRRDGPRGGAGVDGCRRACAGHRPGVTQAAQRPMVSLLVAMRNEERHIARTLESIFAQDYPADRLEVRVYDGDSTDRSVAIAEAVVRGAAAGHGRAEPADHPGRRLEPRHRRGAGGHPRPSSAPTASWRRTTSRRRSRRSSGPARTWSAG